MKRPIELSGISRYRGELMGLAMLFVMFFHVWMPKSNALYGLVRCGNVGVDMFLFLSGIGLWYSWTKDPSPVRFFKKRYLRVYPAWLVIACLFYIPNYLNTPGGGYSPDIPNLIANILIGWSFWRIDDLTFWFIPSIMMLYTIAPAYMNLIQRSPSYRWLAALSMLLAVMVQYYPPVHQAVGHLEIFFSRIPIFLIGLNCGQMVKEKRTIEGSSIWLILLTFVMSLAMCIEFEESWRGRFPLFLERMVYIPLTISGILLFSELFRHTPQRVLRVLAFIGTISLEMYLIHIQFVLKNITQYRLGYLLTALAMIAISTVLAWILHKIIDKATAPLTKKKG